MRERVTIQRATVTKDALGGDVETWAALYQSVPAEVRYLSGREALEAQRISATASLFVTIRYRRDISTGMRLVWEQHGKTFEIALIENKSDAFGHLDTALVLWCAEVQGQIGQVA